MPAFAYRVARPDGTTLEGRAEGNDEQAVRSQLEGEGLLVFRLRRLGALPSFLDAGWWTRRTLPLQEFLIFNQEFLALLKAGLPILKVWDLLIERTRRPAFQGALRTVRQDVRGGASLAEALSRHSSQFPDLYIASVRAGEQSGNLPEVLQRYIAYLKLIIGLRQKMMKALSYPAFLVVVGVAVVAFLLTYVLPTFSAVYGESATAIPPATKALIALVQAFQANFFAAAVLLAASAAGFRMWIRTPGGRARWDRFILTPPLIGEILINHYTVQFTRTLGTVLGAGTPLVTALPIVRGAVSNRFIADGLAAATERVREGSTLAAALGQARTLPRLALEMVAVGEETGALETMLRDVAELYEGDLDQRLNQLTTWIEPVLLLIMGVIVGAIVIVMYLPIFQMAGTVR
jgi:type IV pilus assembly protein PilC